MIYPKRCLNELMSWNKMAACALNQRLLCFSNSYSRTATKPCSTWLPSSKTIVFSIPRNKGRLSLTSWTSRSSSEANTQTAESCVSLGLSLFSKGRVMDSFWVPWILNFADYFQISVCCMFSSSSFLFSWFIFMDNYVAFGDLDFGFVA